MRDTTCPTCGTEMTAIGCCLVIGFPVHWCAKCGTIRPCDNDAVAPADAYKTYNVPKDRLL